MLVVDDQDRRRVSEAYPPQPPQFVGNRKRMRPGVGPPKLQFGEHGELTAQTIQQANLTPEERARAEEMLEVQAAFIEIFDCLSCPADPDGHVHDLSALGPTKIAIAWTLALKGFRSSGKTYIKKRAVPGALYKDAHTWVDIRAADSAEEELKPEHRADDPRLPPDTRRLAAIRDNAPRQELAPEWKVKPEVVWVDEPRKQKEAQ